MVTLINATVQKLLNKGDNRFTFMSEAFPNDISFNTNVMASYSNDAYLNPHHFFVMLETLLWVPSKILVYSKPKKVDQAPYAEQKD